jgi:hypothetical protein
MLESGTSDPYARYIEESLSACKVLGIPAERDCMYIYDV